MMQAFTAGSAFSSSDEVEAIASQNQARNEPLQPGNQPMHTFIPEYKIPSILQVKTTLVPVIPCR